MSVGSRKIANSNEMKKKRNKQTVDEMVKKSGENFCSLRPVSWVNENDMEEKCGQKRS